MSGPDPRPVEAYLEIGAKRTFAGAIEWPGWCRAGRDEAAALQALVDCAPRYAEVVRPAGLGFVAARDRGDLLIVERLAGNAATDFGAPGKAPSADDRPLDEADLARLRTILGVCWAAFDRAVEQASGVELRKGPRGGGRDAPGIVDHVLSAEAGYLSRLGRKAPMAAAGQGNAHDALERSRAAVLDAVDAAARGTMPTQGPRGGAHWSARYAVRRVAWHVLDHAWEIEDRSTS